MSWKPGPLGPDAPSSTLGCSRTDHSKREGGQACCPSLQRNGRPPPQLEAVPWGAGPNLGLSKPTECLCVGCLRRGEQQSVELGLRATSNTTPCSEWRWGGQPALTQGRTAEPMAGTGWAWRTGGVCTCSVGASVSVPGRVCLWDCVHMQPVSGQCACVRVCVLLWRRRYGLGTGKCGGRGRSLTLTESCSFPLRC